MSKVRSRGHPVSAATKAAPASPPAGPESSRREVWRAARTCRDRLPAALHDRDLRTRQAGGEAPDIALDQGSDAGVDPGCDPALVLAGERQDFGRGRDEHILRHAPRQGPLGTIVEIGKQQVDGDRLGGEPRDHGLELVQIDPAQGLDPLPVRAQPSTGFETKLGRDRRVPRRGLQIVEIRSRLATDGQDIGKPAVGNIEGADSLAFQDGIGRNRAAVDDMQPRRFQSKLGDSLQDRLLGRRGCREDLVRSNGSVVPEHQIGEGATGIDTDDDHLD
jgi:hypothetical protein